MKKYKNLIAVFLLVALLGIMAGCGCGTASNGTGNDMVGNTTEESQTGMDGTIPNDNTDNVPNNDPYTDDNMNNTTVSGNEYDNTGTPAEDGAVGGIVDDAGNIVGDVIDDAGQAVSDVGNGVRNMANDATTNR